MAQPYRRDADVPPPGTIDRSLGEFWVNNPWDITSAGHNLSNNERQRFFLNRAGLGFFDVSFLSGADAEGDGRCAVPADLRNNGQLDLVVRKVGGGTLVGDRYAGGPITIFENQLPGRHYLEVSLRGRHSNRQGIGARLIAEVGGQRLYRDLYPLNSFESQSPAMVHLGLGDFDRVDRLTIQWPSRTESVQVFTNLAADRHILVEEGSTAFTTLKPGEIVRP